MESKVGCWGWLGLIVVCFTYLDGYAQDVNPVHIEARIDRAVAKYGVSGKGVIVATVDRGIDFRHPDFINEDGTSRIAWLLDFTDNSGASAPDNPYKKGTIYSKSDLDAALRGQKTVNSTDRGGHGTATTGIAAGNGRGLPNRKYRGVASEARLIVVKLVQDPFPAYGNQPGQALFYDRSLIPVAIDFVRDKALALGLPCVMLLNIGSIGGPTDGTSDLCRKIDEVTGPGMIFVTGTGDDGGAQNRAGGTLQQGQQTTLQFEKVSTEPLYLDLWYAGEDRFDVTLQTPSGNSGILLSPKTNTDYFTKQTPEYNLYHLGSDLDFYSSTNGKRELWIRLDGPPGSYALTLHGAAIQTGRFVATLSPTFYFDRVARRNRFLTHVLPGGSIWDMATAKTNIAPNSYVYRTQWVDIDGIARSVTDEGNLGELWPGSSIGPTDDGRQGVTISAPGESTFTSYSPNSYFGARRPELIQDGQGYYGRLWAVSSAAPLLTGAIALLLEKMPKLDPAAIKDILSKSARTDQFTGQVPNTQWGYGKLDVLAALDEVAKRTNCLVPEIAEGIKGNNQVCTGSHSYSISATAGAQYNWSLLGGERVGAGTGISVNWTKPGTYTLAVTPSSVCGTGTARSLQVTVRDIPTKPVITYADNQLTSSAPANNQWFLNGQPIAGATSQTYPSTQSGQYTVQTANDCGKSELSTPYTLLITGLEPQAKTEMPEIYPNPVREHLTVRFPTYQTWLYIQLRNSAGQLITSVPYQPGDEMKIGVGGLSAGSYWIDVVSKSGVFRKKLLVL